MVNGLLVLGYFLLSYIAMAPLMRDDNGEIQLDSAVVALTLGVVTGGILLLIALNSGVNSQKFLQTSPPQTKSITFSTLSSPFSTS